MLQQLETSTRLSFADDDLESVLSFEEEPSGDTLFAIQEVLENSDFESDEDIFTYFPISYHLADNPPKPTYHPYIPV